MRTFFDTYDQLPKMSQLLCFLLLLWASASFAESLTLKQSCINSLKNYKSYFKEEVLDQACDQVAVYESCYSADAEPIFHKDFDSKRENPKKILVLSLIHGDEKQAGELGRFWLERLSKIEARNSWRIIPIANPDGVKKNTRTNTNGVDLNRNFPTNSWSAEAVKYWEKYAKKSPRRFPGASPGSEPETQCFLKHFSDYKPDFVVSIHTPLNVLDFDGPKLKTKPAFEYLPWKSLGTFPGSLGRYLWAERATPVLTTELKSQLPAKSTAFEQLQDLIGTLVKTDFK
ncbi:MAG: M14 family zinc carboxypeptidase [Bdellovibrionota bacterium]